MEVTLYTTHCPKCKTLATLLERKALEFQVIDDEKIMLEKGFMSVPMLEVDGQIMDYKAATDWIRNL